MLRRVAFLLILGTLLLLLQPARAEDPMVWVARYPLSPDHPAVSIGWSALQGALAPEIDLQLRIGGPPLGSAEALETLARGQIQAGMLALASYPKSFPYWSMLGEMFLIGRDGLAAAAAISELVMLECPHCQDNLTRQKLVFLGSYSAAPYGLVAPTPLTEPLSLEGQVLATPGSLWDRMVEELGAAAAGSVDDPRQALALGHVTALVDVPGALRDPYLAGRAVAFTRLPLGSYRGASPLTISRDAWRRLSGDQRRRVFRAAASALYELTDAYRRQHAETLAAAGARGLIIADGGLLLEDRVRRFASADLQRLIEVAEQRFGVTDAEAFTIKLTGLYDKWATLLAPGTVEKAAIRLLQAEIFDRLDVQAYGGRQ